MSATNAAETAVLNLIFNNSAWANVGDASGLQPSSAAGSFYVSLHTADPAETGNQTSNETSYTGYARVAVARSASGWTVSGNAVSPTNNIDFGQKTDAGSVTITHIGLGSASTGTGNLFFIFALSSSITVDQNEAPQISSSSSFTVD